MSHPSLPRIGAPPVAAHHVARLKAVVRAELRLPSEAVVILSELRCADRDCAPVETMIAVLADGDRRVWRLAGPVGELAPHVVRAHVTDHPQGGPS